ncbi:MAG: hypothetical protein KGZ96_04510 [Clostridia bacterium]|nr:hypothetical protein [Clostridia bacterium]
MNFTRRNFFKISGIWAIGLGVLPVYKTVTGSELSSGKFLPGKDELTGHNWAMVVDLNKCQDDCQDCVKACHGIHNVPAINNSKEEVKWLWLEPCPKALPNLEHKYLDNRTKNKAVPVLCNHCESEGRDRAY